MARQFIPITVVGGSTFGRYLKISSQKIFNLFMSDGWLVNFSGWKKIIELESSANQVVEGRGFFRSIRGNLILAVVNSSVWLLDESIGASFIGNISTANGPVFMDENLNGQTCIVDGTYAYIYNRFTNSLTRQTTTIPDDLIPVMVCFHDTYFHIGNGNTTGNGAKWYVFQFETDSTIEVADGGVLSLQTKPDYARAIVRLSEKGKNVIVFGTAVTEIHINSPLTTGLETLLYQRIPTINIDYGVLSLATIASSDDMVCWLAINEKSAPVIMYFDGNAHHTISTDGINYQLGTLKNPGKSVGFFYKKDGHLFYQITFYDEQDNITLAYDFTEKNFLNLSDYNLNFHPARQVIYVGQRTFFISLTNGAIYETGTDFTTYDENIAKKGRPNYLPEHNHIIPRQAVCGTYRFNGELMPQPVCGIRLTLAVEQGQDLDYSELSVTAGCSDVIITEEGETIITEEDEDVITEGSTQCFTYVPGIDLSFSQDGAQTWSNEVRAISNYTAERQNITEWTGFGQINEFTPKFKFWTAGRVVCGNAMLEILT